MALASIPLRPRPALPPSPRLHPQPYPQHAQSNKIKPKKSISGLARKIASLVNNKHDDQHPPAPSPGFAGASSLDLPLPSDLPSPPPLPPPPTITLDSPPTFSPSSFFRGLHIDQQQTQTPTPTLRLPPDLPLPPAPNEPPSLVPALANLRLRPAPRSSRPVPVPTPDSSSSPRPTSLHASPELPSSTADAWPSARIRWQPAQLRTPLVYTHQGPAGIYSPPPHHAPSSSPTLSIGECSPNPSLVDPELDPGSPTLSIDFDIGSPTPSLDPDTDPLAELLAVAHELRKMHRPQSLALSLSLLLPARPDDKDGNKDGASFVGLDEVQAARESAVVGDVDRRRVVEVRMHRDGVPAIVVVRPESIQSHLGLGAQAGAGALLDLDASSSSSFDRHGSVDGRRLSRAFDGLGFDVRWDQDRDRDTLRVPDVDERGRVDSYFVDSEHELGAEDAEGYPREEEVYDDARAGLLYDRPRWPSEPRSRLLLSSPPPMAADEAWTVISRRQKFVEEEDVGRSSPLTRSASLGSRTPPSPSAYTDTLILGSHRRRRSPPSPRRSPSPQAYSYTPPEPSLPPPSRPGHASSSLKSTRSSSTRQSSLPTISSPRILPSWSPTLPSRSPSLSGRSPTLSSRSPTLPNRSPTLPGRSPTLSSRSSAHSSTTSSRSPRTIPSRSPTIPSPTMVATASQLPTIPSLASRAQTESTVYRAPSSRASSPRVRSSSPKSHPSPPKSHNSGSVPPPAPILTKDIDNSPRAPERKRSFLRRVLGQSTGAVNAGARAIGGIEGREATRTQTSDPEAVPTKTRTRTQTGPARVSTRRAERVGGGCKDENGGERDRKRSRSRSRTQTAWKNLVSRVAREKGRRCEEEEREGEKAGMEKVSVGRPRPLSPVVGWGWEEKGVLAGVW